MPSLRSLTRLLLAVLLLLSWTAGGRADRIVTGSATLQGDGSYLYQYTLTNPGSAALRLQEFGIWTAGTPNVFTLASDLQNVSQPSGWTFGYAPPTQMYAWSTTMPGQGAGQTADFSFTTRQPPITVGYFGGTEAPSGAYGFSFSGQVTGPGIPAAPPLSFSAPEPASALLLVTGGGLLLLRRWRRR